MEAEQKDTRFTLENEHVKVVLSSFGATIVSLNLPDKDGKWADCVLGFDTMQEYDRGRDENPCFGSMIGRFANRVANAKFTIEGNETVLDVNCGEKHHLHGGLVGYHRKDWQSKQDGNNVHFFLKSEDGDDKYPGELEIEVIYMLQDAKLTIEMKAKHISGNATPINLTNHSYFNLDGHDFENGVLDHKLKINAGAFTPTDADSIPTKEVHKFENNQDPMAFLDFKNMKEAVFELGKSKGYTQEELDETVLKRTGKGGPTSADPLGFDHNYILDSYNGELRKIAELKGSSGRVMEVHSDSPGVQLYTANYIGSVKGKSGANYQQRAALCLETQAFPDSIGYDKQDDFAAGKCQILGPNNPTYKHVCSYTFDKE